VSLVSRYKLLKQILRILIVIGLLLLNTISVLASDSVTITVSLVPLYTGGISNFLITYVNEQQMDLNWGFSGDAVNIMIRSKYSDYPLDIPNQNTAPSDGNLVYYGNATNFSDTSMNFDDNPGTLFYSAWGQRADGTWHTIKLSGSEESAVVLLIAILTACVGLTVGGFALRRPAIAFLGAGFWLANIVYCFVKTASMWDAYYVIGFISIAGVIVCVLDGAMILTHKEEKEEEGDDGLDPDVRELMKDRELMYRESNALRGRPTRHTEKKQAKGLLP
jgi:hypothetical protein